MRPDMEEGLFRFIWTRSRRRQVIALALTLGSLPLLYLSLELPKAIINEAIGGDEWPRQLLSRSIDQLPYLLLLCLAFISLVAINAFIRHRVNVLKAQISVRLLSQLRFELIMGRNVLTRAPDRSVVFSSARSLLGFECLMIILETEPGLPC